MNIDVYTDHGQIDRKIIEDYAESIGYKFPKSYVELLSKHNGLTPQNNYFEFLDHNNEFTEALLHKPICKGFFSDIIFK
ncbi:SMI1/KNR4 family protein [Acinetobacter schindleri]|uniref:SMI1/KNR4 family protein n=1 Tax=Acinetobacter schindleri TaxID=108981 RepID=UPI00073DA462|nr:SMI1/KNR4 family protein [Acinetobacter schindleri]